MQAQKLAETAKLEGYVGMVNEDKDKVNYVKKLEIELTRHQQELLTASQILNTHGDLITKGMVAVDEKVDKLVASNETVSSTMKAEAGKLTRQSQDLITKLGNAAETTIGQSIKNLDEQTGALLARLNKVVTEVEDTHKQQQINKWVTRAWRWAVLMTVSTTAIAQFHIDNPISMLKIWLAGVFM